MNLAELRRLEAEATPGPWELDAVFILDGKKERAGVYTSEENPSEDDLICELRYADAALIVAMRNALPELLRKAEAFDRIVAQGGEPHGGVDVG